MSKIAERKEDLPSVTYIAEKYNFSPAHTDLTVTDIMEELNAFYIEEQTRKIIQELIKDGKDGTKATDMLDRVAKGFSEVRQAVTKAYTIDLQADIDKVVDEYVKVGANGAWVKTGFQQLDDIVGLRTGDMVGICGGTGGGKTLTMVKMQATCIENGISSMFFSLEMGLSQMTNRLLATLKKIPFSETHNNRVTPEEYKAALVDIAKTQTHIVTRQSESKIDVATIERYVVEHKPKVVFIDYLTLIDADTAWNAEASVTKDLKRIALQNNCLMIFACQADTDTVKNGNVPELTGARGNKSFPYDCDVFMGLASQRLEADEGRMKVYYAVRKSRNGGFPEWSMRVQANTGTWDDSTGESW